MGEEGSFPEGFKEFRKKFKEKTGDKWEDRTKSAKTGKYTYLELSDDDSSGDEDDAPENWTSMKSKGDTPPPTKSELPSLIQHLIGLIFNQQYFDQTMAEFEYDANKMPLGKLSKKALKDGYKKLQSLVAAIDANDVSTFKGLSNQYFSLIPHDFGRNRPPVLNNILMVK